MLQLSYDLPPMHSWKIVTGIITLALAWIILFRSGLIYKLNAFMREYIFNDQLVLFSGKRVAVLLFLLGCLALFSGIEDVREHQPIRPNIASTILQQATQYHSAGRHRLVIYRCRELIRSDPKNIEAWELLTQSYLAMGDKEQARQAVEAIVRLDPDHHLGRAKWFRDLESINKPQ